MLEGYDWFHFKDCLFYNLITGDTATYKLPTNYDSKTGLFCCTKTEYIKKLKGPWPKIGVLNWIKNQNNIKSTFQYVKAIKGVCTDGAESISDYRKAMYSNSKNYYKIPFYPPEQNIEEIIPKDLLPRILKFKEKQLTTDGHI